MMNEEAAYIRDLVRRGGPDPDDYDALSTWYSRIMARLKSAEISRNEIRSLWLAFGESFTPRTMQGFVVTKPHGYHGDFEVIDRIYTEWVAKEQHLRKWDLWFHQLHAPRAVRNRKAYLHGLLSDLAVHTSRRPIHVLDVGCGPCRDVLEFLALPWADEFLFTCLDQDAEALNYARSLCADYSSRIDFQCSPILGAMPGRAFDLAWCAGVFDYLDEHTFRTTLSRLIDCVAEGGQVVLGNFSPLNPTRPVMEFGGWELFHRSESELLSLAVQCGIEREQITIGREPEGVNIFMHVRKRT